MYPAGIFHPAAQIGEIKKGDNPHIFQNFKKSEIRWIVSCCLFTASSGLSYMFHPVSEIPLSAGRIHALLPSP